jgi:hypothetical protein
VGPEAGMATSAVNGVLKLLKPVGVKGGTSLSNSEGTSVGESTYLVAQMAKFDVDLLAYEKCTVVRLSDQAIGELGISAGDSAFTRRVVMGSTVNFQDPRVLQAATNGLLVCEGEEAAKKNSKKTVEEMYFYFTQHFTEGDMLDQAELYNHPWLLALRGMRDYTAFITKVRSQEKTSLWNTTTKTFHLTPRPMAEALDHMRNQFANTFPSFPGFYTELNPSQDIKAFLLQQSRKQVKKVGADGDLSLDPNGEVSRPNVTTAPKAGPR